jgi:phospholipid transport system substrate-binding protein
MLRRSLLTAAVVLIAGVLAPTIPATAGSDPAAFINNLDNQFQIVARNPAAEQRLAGFRQLFREDFDVPGLGRFVLGRFARILNPSEQQEFLGLFETYVVYTYSDRLAEFAADGGVTRVTGSRVDAGGTIVSSVIIRGQTVRPIKVDWRLTERDGVYKISDVIIDGLSMAVTGRSELEGVAERNGGQPQAILAVMRQECANAALRWMTSSPARPLSS